MTEVRNPPRTLLPDPVGSEHHQPTSLRGRAHKARVNKRHRFRDLYRCLNAELRLPCGPALHTAAARGGANGTAKASAETLHAHIEALVQRLKTKRYRAKRVRRGSRPTENGTDRPLGIPALEENLVPLACAKLLTAIYEQDVLACRYGYRPGRGALEAVRDRPFALQDGRYGSVVEGDVQGFFDHVDHPWLVDMLRVRIDARAFLNLIGKWRTAGVVATEGHVVHPDTGTPQGGTTVSPVLANAYLHDAWDLWCPKGVTVPCRGEALLCRYADDVRRSQAV